MRVGWSALVGIPLILSGCYGAKMVRQPITVEETAQDLEAVRQQQVALERRLEEMEKRSAEQAELLRGMKAETSSRWEDLDGRLMAIDAKLRDALGSRGGYASPPSNWSANPSGRARPDTTGSGSALDPSAGSPIGGSPAPPLDEEAEIKRVYDQAYLDLSRGNYSLAVLGFREFLRRSPSSELGDNAQYWIGECFYAQRDFTTAVQEFTKVEEQYPTGDKLPAALLKIGYSYLQLEDRASARRYLNQVMEQFPNSDEANLAKNKLRSAG